MLAFNKKFKSITVVIFVLITCIGFFLANVTHADSSTPSKWFGTYGAQTSTSLTRYFSPFGGNTPTTEGNTEQITPSSGTLQKLNVKLDAAPGSGKSYVITFRKEHADTTLTCTISDLATSCSDIIHTATVTAGDRLSVSITPSGTPAAARVSFNLEFVPTTSGETVFMGGTNGNYASDESVSYDSFTGVGPGPTEGNLYTVVPANGTLKNLYFRLSAAPGTSNSRTFTLRKNGADTALTVTFNAADSGVLSDTTHTVTVTAGDTITLKVTGVGTPALASGQFGATFVPDNVGDFSIPITNSTVSNSAVNYLGLTGVNTVSATENLVQTLGSSDYTLTGIYIKLTAPGAGKSFTTGLREDATDASNPFTVTISGSSATTGFLTGQSFTPKDGSLYDTIITPSGTPTAGRTFISYLGHITPVTPDTTSPTPGNSGTITTASITGHTLTLDWTKGTDDVSTQANLQYEVRQSASNNIDTVGNAETNGTIIKVYTADINTFNVTNLTANTTYYFNVIVKDQAGNKSIYTTKSETTTSGNTYYVDNTNGSASDSNAGTNSSAPWLTIGKCASTMLPGDTCEIDGTGTYDERPIFTQIGTAQNPIVIKAASDCVPGNACPKVRGIDLLSGNNYTTVRGLEFTNSGMSADANEAIRLYTSNSYVSILNNYVHDTTNICINVGNASFLHIAGNTISHCNITTHTYGDSAGISNYFNRDSTDVLVENNTISHVSDYNNPRGARWVFRGNTWGPIDAANIGHVDGAQPNSITPDSLMENNLLINNSNDNNHLLVNQASGSDNWIIRMNRVCQSHGMILAGYALEGHYYNNTFGTNPKATANVSSISLTDNATGFSRNEIFYKSDNTYINPYGTLTGATIDKDYDLYYLVGNPSETHSVNADPLFVDESSCDLNLQSSSPAIDTGGPLTTVDGGDSGTGTSLVLSDAGYFQPGWAGTNGDWVAVGTVGNTVQISVVDYTTNTLTLANSITRSVGDSVWLYKKSDGTRILYGSAPDIGALEFNGTPTYTIGGTTSGLSGSVVLQNNSGDNLTLSSNGSFTFSTALNNSTSYAVTVLTQPTGQSCTVGNGSGTVSSANVTNVTVTCANTTKAITAFDFNGLTPAVVGSVNETNKTIALTVPYGTAVTALVPTITQTGSSVSPASGVAQDFTTPATYTVTAANASTQAYIVTVSVGAAPVVTSSGGGNGPIYGSTRHNISILLATTTPPCTTSTQSIILTRNLSRGSEGNDVTLLQNFLVSKNFLTSDSITGYFGITTETAIKAFQKSSGLVSSGTPQTTGYGNVGPVTRAKINSLGNTTTCILIQTNTVIPANTSYNFARNLSLNMTGEDVRQLQQFLNTNGFTISTTGAGSPGKETTLFGTLTYKALVKFQKSIGWSGTGFFGPMTREYIKNNGR